MATSLGYRSLQPLLTGAIAAHVANDPAPILCLLPTESDCRDYVVSEIEPLFAATPAVAGALAADTDEAARNTQWGCEDSNVDRSCASDVARGTVAAPNRTAADSVGT
jgi:hypothetical protein